MTKLPLDFSSIYRTNANSANWYQEERLEASGAFISDDGILSRADCSLTDTELCNISELTLKNISNASTSYLRTSNFYNNTIDFNDINVTSGTLYVNASDARTWRNDSANWQQKNNRDRECQSDNQIRFQNSVIAGTKTEFQYSSYSQGYQKSDCDLVRHYYFPILRTQTFIDNIAGNSLELSYYIPDITRSGVSDNLPYDFISNRLTIDPTQVIKDIAALPRTLKELDEIRELLMNGIMYSLHITKIVKPMHILKLVLIQEMICSGIMPPIMMIDYMANLPEKHFLIELVQNLLFQVIYMGQVFQLTPRC